MEPIIFELSFSLNRENGCWEWKRYIGTHGYGVLKRNYLAHRFSYEKFIGEIPEKLQLDHICRNRKCVNPFHLECVTPSENVRRGSRPKMQTSKTKCPSGHDFTEENTYTYPDGRRGCRICRKIARTKNKNKKDRTKMSDRTSCPRGHKYTEETTYLNPKGQRVCKQCIKRRSKEAYKKRKENG